MTDTLKKKVKIHLIDSMRRAHSALDVERAHILPVFLEQRDQEVDGQVNVGRQLFGLHAHIADRYCQAQHLKQTNIYIYLHILIIDFSEE